MKNFVKKIAVVVLVCVLAMNVCAMAEEYGDIFSINNFLRIAEEYESDDVIILFPSHDYVIGEHLEAGNYLVSALVDFGRVLVETTDGEFAEVMDPGDVPMYAEFKEEQKLYVIDAPAAFLKLD